MALVSSSDGSGRDVGNLKEKEGSLLLVGTRGLAGGMVCPKLRSSVFSWV